MPKTLLTFFSLFALLTIQMTASGAVPEEEEDRAENGLRVLVWNVLRGGNKVEEGRKILADAAHPLVTLAGTMDEGADKAAELAAK